MQEKSGNKAFEVVTGLEPSLCVHFIQPSTIFFMNSYIVYPLASLSKCIITTIRLSGSSWRRDCISRSTYCSQAVRLFSVLHVILLFHPLCPTIDISQLCKYHKHVLQSWAWDHERHITAYDLSRQRRRSVILVYIPHEITVNTTIFTDYCIMRSIRALSNESDYTMMQYVQFRLGLISDNFRLSLAEFKLPVFPGCHFLSSCHHFVNHQWLVVLLYHHIFMCSDNSTL